MSAATLQRLSCGLSRVSGHRQQRFSAALACGGPSYGGGDLPCSRGCLARIWPYISTDGLMGSGRAHACPWDKSALLDQLAASIRLRQLSAVRAKKVHAINLSLVEN
jgi:hypothetical protein